MMKATKRIFELDSGTYAVALIAEAGGRAAYAGAWRLDEGPGGLKMYVFDGINPRSDDYTSRKNEILNVAFEYDPQPGERVHIPNMQRYGVVLPGNRAFGMIAVALDGPGHPRVQVHVTGIEPAAGSLLVTPGYFG